MKSNKKLCFFYYHVSESELSFKTFLIPPHYDESHRHDSVFRHGLTRPHPQALVYDALLALPAPVQARLDRPPGLDKNLELDQTRHGTHSGTLVQLLVQFLYRKIFNK